VATLIHELAPQETFKTYIRERRNASRRPPVNL